MPQDERHHFPTFPGAGVWGSMKNTRDGELGVSVKTENFKWWKGISVSVIKLQWGADRLRLSFSSQWGFVPRLRALAGRWDL